MTPREIFNMEDLNVTFDVEVIEGFLDYVIDFANVNDAEIEDEAIVSTRLKYTDEVSVDIHAVYFSEKPVGILQKDEDTGNQIITVVDESSFREMVEYIKTFIDDDLADMKFVGMDEEIELLEQLEESED